MKWFTVALAAMALAAPVAPASAAGLRPFAAEYSVKYSSLSVGSSRLELRRDSQPGRWILETKADASGLARLIASGTLVQTSWLEVGQDGVRPLRFRFNDGMARSKEDVDLVFDWAGGRVSGTAKEKPVDEPTVANLQDPVSIQIATMRALQDGRQPGQQSMIEGRKIKTYDYAFQRQERIKTGAGSYEALVYTSSRAGSDRVTHMWLAPELGYLAVQVEQYRKGKRLFGMYLDSYQSRD